MASFVVIATECVSAPAIHTLMIRLDETFKVWIPGEQARVGMTV